MSLYPFPDVPDADGVPSVPRDNNNSGNSTSSTTTTTTAVPASQSTQRWGIYDSDGKLIGQASDGTSATISDAGPSTYTFDYRKETTISDFPLEEGSFAAYNKVERPGSPTVNLIVSGSEDQRTAFLDAVDSACTSTDLYSVVTPEFTYPNFSVESYSYSRSNEKGANMILVEIVLKEIRTVSAAYTSTSPRNTSAETQTNSGKVQAVTPSSSVQSSVTSKTGVSA